MYIAVVGAGEEGIAGAAGGRAGEEASAREAGELLARGCVVVCGGLGGVMAAACQEGVEIAGDAREAVAALLG